MEAVINFLKAVGEHYLAGGIFMHPISVIGLIAIYLIIERSRKLYGTKFDKAAITSEVRNAIYSGRLHLVGQTIIHKIIQAGFQAFERSKSDAEVQIAIDAAASKYFPQLEKNTQYLATLANISTLLGLLGTISGLIISFAAAASVEPDEKATKLAEGISEAMNCTAFGLIVAIPTLFAFAFLQGRTQALIDQVNEVVLDAMNFVVIHKDKLGEESKSNKES